MVQYDGLGVYEINIGSFDGKFHEDDISELLDTFICIPESKLSIHKEIEESSELGFKVGYEEGRKDFEVKGEL